MVESQNKLNNKLDEFELLTELGRGLNAKVYLGKNGSEEKFAIKRLQDVTISNMKAITNEFEVLKKIEHENVIRLYHFREGTLHKSNGTKKPNVPYACIELAPNGEFFQYLSSCGELPEPIARYYFKSLINGLEYCHKQGFAHRDIKLENILLDSKFTFKLADFGFATALAGKDGSGKLQTFLGTESYMAPEIHAGKAYSGEAVDLFAAGVVLFVMVTGAPPFDQAIPKDPFYYVFCSNKPQKFWEIFAEDKPEGFLSAEFISLMTKMLAFDPAKRLSISQIQSDPWYLGPTASTEEVVAYMSACKTKLDEETKIEKEKAESIKKKESQNVQMRMGYRSLDDFDVAEALGKIQINGTCLKDIRIPVLEEFSRSERTLSTSKYSSLGDISKSIVTILDPLEIVDIICKHYAIKNDNEKMDGVTFDEKQYKVKGLVYKSSLDKSSELECCRNVDISFKVLKLDEKLNVVNFYKNGGNAILFYQIIKELREIFGKASSSFIENVTELENEQQNN